MNPGRDRHRLVAAAVLGTVLLVSGMGIRPSATAQATAYLQIVHAVPDLGAVDALVEGQPIARRLGRGTASDWKTMPGGGTRLQIRASDDGTRGLLDVPVDLAAGGAATVVLIGRTADEPSLRAPVLHGGPQRPGNGRVALRFVNTVAGTAAVKPPRLMGCRPNMLASSSGQREVVREGTIGAPPVFSYD